MTAQEQFDAMRAFVAANLADIAREILDWHGTSLLIDGKVRKAARMLGDEFGTDRLTLVENHAASLAFEAVATKENTR